MEYMTPFHRYPQRNLGPVIILQGHSATCSDNFSMSHRRSSLSDHNALTHVALRYKEAVPAVPATSDSLLFLGSVRWDLKDV